MDNLITLDRPALASSFAFSVACLGRQSEAFSPTGPVLPRATQKALRIASSTSTSCPPFAPEP